MGEIIYGRRAVAEAEVGRRNVLRKWTAPETSPLELTEMADSPDHQGVVAEVEPYPYADPSILLRDGGIVIALDEVQDPRNLGAVCRSAEVAGAAGVVICERRAASVTGVVCKTSAGAVEHLPVARVRNLTDWLEQAKQQGAWIYGAAAEGSTPYTKAELTGPTVLVMGSEGKGLRPRVAAACDMMLNIPMHGRLDSLNISVAASIMLFEAVRQRGN